MDRKRCILMWLCVHVVVVGIVPSGNQKIQSELKKNTITHYIVKWEPGIYSAQ
jgi:hypothetical protein